MPVQILIIDDEADVCSFFRRLLTKKGYEVTTATNGPDALLALAAHSFSVAMVDLKLPDTDGLTLLQAIKSRQPACEVIIMTGYSTVKTAVTAMQQGAYEYLEKPFDDIGEIEDLIARAVAQRNSQQQGGHGKEEWSEVASAVGFQIGSSPLMRRLVSLAYKVAGKNINVLIQGKTGTGKEVLARFIHAASNRAEGAFIPVNCGALPENLLESELFGHERGAFTGANQTRRGIFELANHGTLLLDEIGDASPMIQVKLLRVLETGEFMRVGGERPIKSDVRVIAATNVNLEEAISEKTFREDLYYRLNVVRLELPSLQQRREDIPLLAEHFVSLFNPKAHISPSAMLLLQNHGWPGNIRELANVMRRAVVMCPDDTILSTHLNDRFQGAALPPVKAAKMEMPGAKDFLLACEGFQGRSGSGNMFESLEGPELDRLLDALRGIEVEVLSAMRMKGVTSTVPRGLKEIEEDTIKKALNLHQWNITETARSLGIGRNTLYRKIKQFNLTG
ncbi:MAG: sigma-54 dependent transcriptional regulator [Desulfuromonadaceae bacterium]|nr:sigma-54 dependent transcriptional regulator [Desulfuromonadaceae bacterium]MDD2846896.1 sigma-54 dependent transcriptional regulator [Desulfuromonadaceae bacterium]MDD4129126.1 sigma-54 dependent transcriptional regulator [Desulfuromonadaceae bacterium]